MSTIKRVIVLYDGLKFLIFRILDFGEFGNYKTELVSRIYSGAKLADCQGAPIMGELEPDLLEH